MIQDRPSEPLGESWGRLWIRSTWSLLSQMLWTYKGFSLPIRHSKLQQTTGGGKFGVKPPSASATTSLNGFVTSQRPMFIYLFYFMHIVHFLWVMIFLLVKGVLSQKTKAFSSSSEMFWHLQLSKKFIIPRRPLGTRPECFVCVDGKSVSVKERERFMSSNSLQATSPPENELIVFICCSSSPSLCSSKHQFCIKMLV